MKRIGILSGGGDAPGFNPAIKAVTMRAADENLEVVGIYDGWEGLLDEHLGETVTLDALRVRTWDRDGGTHLGSSRTNPFHCPRGPRVGRVVLEYADRSGEILANVAKLGLDALVTIGGEDTLGVSRRLAEKGAPIIGIPKSIDFDLQGTDYTLGFDSSIRTCADIIGNSRTPAGSHHWVQIIEVMGRYAGHLALWSGIAGGAFMCLIPEVPFDLARVIQLIQERLELGSRDRKFPRYAILVVAEGATPAGGKLISVAPTRDDFGHVQLGGVGAWLAERIRKETAYDARAAALGHPQRGGPPSPVDRIMGHLFGTAAVEAALQGKFGHMVAARGIVPSCHVTTVSLDEATRGVNQVDVAKYYDVMSYSVKRTVLGTT
ncbi:MAG TPA: ATP-dependent 6-phosphofructokinase [Polyangia bacterium]|jgi:6-phosphofructokinase 1